MYKNILVPVVFDENHDNHRTFEIARALATKDAKFTVVHVMETIPNYATAEIPDDVLKKARAGIETSLIETAKVLPGASPKLISGHAGSAIVDYASKNNIDCIVIASHRPEFSDIFLGSTAARVVRHAQCAVHVLR